MVICLEQGANDLHMVQLMPLPPRHLLLHQNPEWFILLVTVVLEKRPLNGCVCVVLHMVSELALSQFCSVLTYGILW